MKLGDLLRGLSYNCDISLDGIEIADIVYDSRKLIKDCLFVCLAGASSDGHSYAGEAAEKGAKAILAEHRIEELPKEIPVILVENTRKTLALLSQAYFRYPAKEMTIIAITGTKGKTTTAYMTKTILEKAGKKVGVIGTIGAFYGSVKIETKNTTPESYELQKILREMADAKITHVIMEVSSQAFKMFRVEGMRFDYGMFTNISPDHIGEGEHKDFAEYLYCKSLLFQNCKVGILNQDDEKWRELIKEHSCEDIKTYGFAASELEKTTLLKGREIACIREARFIGISFLVSGGYEMEVKVGCMGRFNAYNALGAMTIAYLEKIEKRDVKEALYSVSVRGRVEPIPISEKVHFIIDYAHNAVSTESLLTTVLEYNPKRLVCVFGAGGNRSKLRRYDMGEIAGKYADISILTADNPRFEEVEEIIADIKVGMEKSHGNYIEIPNRKEAIRYSIEHAKEGDIIVLFGKGHEEYQEIKGVRYPFDERVVIKEILEELKIKQR